MQLNPYEKMIQVFVDCLAVDFSLKYEGNINDCWDQFQEKYPFLHQKIENHQLVSATKSNPIFLDSFDDIQMTTLQTTNNYAAQHFTNQNLEKKVGLLYYSTQNNSLQLVLALNHAISDLVCHINLLSQFLESLQKKQSPKMNFRSLTDSAEYNLKLQNSQSSEQFKDFGTFQFKSKNQVLNAYRTSQFFMAKELFSQLIQQLHIKNISLQAFLMVADATSKLKFGLLKGSQKILFQTAVDKRTEQKEENCVGLFVEPLLQIFEVGEFEQTEVLMKKITIQLKNLSDNDFSHFRFETFVQKTNKMMPLTILVSSCGKRTKLSNEEVKDACFTSAVCYPGFKIKDQIMVMHGFELNEGYVINWSHTDNIDLEVVGNIVQDFQTQVHQFSK